MRSVKCWPFIRWRLRFQIETKTNEEHTRALITDRSAEELIKNKYEILVLELITD